MDSQQKDLTNCRKTIFIRLLKNAPAFAPQGGASRRQADAS
jgi:hypothetical protein